MLSNKQSSESPLASSHPRNESLPYGSYYERTNRDLEATYDNHSGDLYFIYFVEEESKLGSPIYEIF